jgi:hypothetical protein
MTILHAYAEKLLNERKALVLPPVGATLGTRSRIRRDAKEYRFDAAKLETMDGETIPDVILYKGAHRMHVEIFVTHQCSEEKRAKIVAAGIAAIEIDLSGLDRASTVAVVNEAILNTARREWIYNRKAQEVLKDLQNEADAEAQAAKKRRQKMIADLAVAYGRTRKQALAFDWKDAEDVAKVIEAGDAKLLSEASGGEGYFTVHPRVWKAAVLNLLHEQFGRSTPAAIVSEFARRRWLVDRFRRPDNCDESLIEEAGLPTGGPSQAVETFLRYLARTGIAVDDGWRWVYTRQHSDELERRLREKQRLAHEAAERSSRHRLLAGLVKDIIAIGSPEGVANFDLGAWLDKPIGNAGDQPRQIADAGNTAWYDLMKALKIVLAVLKDQSEEKAEACGLPVVDALCAMHALHEARATRRKLEAEESARRERQSRVDLLCREAAHQLGDDGEAWLNTPCQNLGGLAPKQAAAESSARLETARWVLRQVAGSRAAKDKWVGELERASTLTRMDPPALTRMDPRSARRRVTAQVHPRSP